jgi:ABC-type nitrate/sulfonate/bicarbonate transport system substrate-binding protein
MNARVTAGFLPLLDSAILVAARQRGFAANEGIDLALVRENSWASIRDRLAVGHFDVAHMLAPMPIAHNLGLALLAARTVVPMALGLGDRRGPAAAFCGRPSPFGVQLRTALLARRLRHRA